MRMIFALGRDQSGKVPVRLAFTVCVLAIAVASSSPAFRANPLFGKTVNEVRQHLPETFDTITYNPFAEYEWHATSRLTLTGGLKYGRYVQNLTQFHDKEGLPSRGDAAGDSTGRGGAHNSPDRIRRDARRQKRRRCAGKSEE